MQHTTSGSPGAADSAARLAAAVAVLLRAVADPAAAHVGAAAEGVAAAAAEADAAVRAARPPPTARQRLATEVLDLEREAAELDAFLRQAAADVAAWEARLAAAATAAASR